MAAALLIAAPASGQGKTTIAAGLARLHARQGHRVRCFKCGPDFLDPLWLQTASAHPVDSLDLWINGADDCARRLAAAAGDAALVIVEGVMGLFDGGPSAADLAERFAIPVLAVVDASAMAATFAAVAHGLRSWRPGLSWAGAFANRVGSERHAAMLRSALDATRAADGGPWMGHLPRRDTVTLPERHLGLAMPRESTDALARLDAVADAIAATPLGQRPLAAWPRWQAPPVETAVLPPPRLAGRRIAVAHDAAFAFVYPANLQVLRAMGAELRFFSPLAGDALPQCDAVWLPGGYPERHAQRLAGCANLREQLAAHVRAGRPLWAECGGMMVLADRLIDADGRSHAMWGLVPGTAVLGRRLAALGAHALSDGTGGIAPLRGHSFHWSRFETSLAPASRTDPQCADGGAGEPVYESGSLRASWFHPWFASSPELAARLFDRGPVFRDARRWSESA